MIAGKTLKQKNARWMRKRPKPIKDQRGSFESADCFKRRGKETKNSKANNA